MTSGHNKGPIGPLDPTEDIPGHRYVPHGRQEKQSREPRRVGGFQEELDPYVGDPIGTLAIFFQSMPKVSAESKK